MSRRRRSIQPFSLFAFQDIITAVTGIVILIMLILCLAIVAEPIAKATVDSPDDREQVELQYQNLHDQVAAMRSQLDQLHAENLAASSNNTVELRNLLSESELRIEQIDKALARLIRDVRSRSEDLSEMQDTVDSRASDFEKVARLEQELQDIHSQINELTAENRVIYNFRSPDNRQAWLVDISTDRMLAAAVGQRKQPELFDDPGERRITSFLEWVGAFDPDRTHLVLIVRPNAVRYFDRIRSELEDRGFRVGLDLLGNDVQVIDPETGAE